jgi:hypothetical protein
VNRSEAHFAGFAVPNEPEDPIFRAGRPDGQVAAGAIAVQSGHRGVLDRDRLNLQTSRAIAR